MLKIWICERDIQGGAKKGSSDICNDAHDELYKKYRTSPNIIIRS